MLPLKLGKCAILLVLCYFLIPQTTSGCQTEDCNRELHRRIRPFRGYDQLSRGNLDNNNNVLRVELKERRVTRNSPQKTRARSVERRISQRNRVDQENLERRRNGELQRSSQRHDLQSPNRFERQHQLEETRRRLVQTRDLNNRRMNNEEKYSRTVSTQTIRQNPSEERNQNRENLRSTTEKRNFELQRRSIPELSRQSEERRSRSNPMSNRLNNVVERRVQLNRIEERGIRSNRIARSNQIEETRIRQIRTNERLTPTTRRATERESPNPNNRLTRNTQTRNFNMISSRNQRINEEASFVKPNAQFRRNRVEASEEQRRISSRARIPEQRQRSSRNVEERRFERLDDRRIRDTTFRDQRNVPNFEERRVLNEKERRVRDSESRTLERRRDRTIDRRQNEDTQSRYPERINELKTPTKKSFETIDLVKIVLLTVTVAQILAGVNPKKFRIPQIGNFVSIKEKVL